jgi:hypothetical protein
MEHDHRDSEKLDEAIDDMTSDAGEMQERSEELGKHIEEARSDWHSKQQDAGVPGAQPRVDEEAEQPPSEHT